MKKTLFAGLMIAILAFCFIGCEDGNGGDSFTEKKFEISNNAATLGITGLFVNVWDSDIISAEIEGGKIVFTSKSEGLTGATVYGPDNVFDAEINLKVDSKGEITQGPIIKGGDPAIKVSGTFGGAFVEGVSYPTRIVPHIEWENINFMMDGAGSWSFKRPPYENELPLWFKVEIELNEADIIHYQYPLVERIHDQDISGITLPRIDIPELITLKGTVQTTLTGTWNRSSYDTVVSISNRNIGAAFYDYSTSPAAILSSIDEGWTGSDTIRKSDGSWEMKCPSSVADMPAIIEGNYNELNFRFSVALTYSQPDGWKGLWAWESGQKHNIFPETDVNLFISNTVISGIDLGTIPFVVISGNTQVTVNGLQPYSYNIEFGYYDWSEGEPNGWSGATAQIFKDAGTGTAWSVPMPANITLDANLNYSVSRNKHGKVQSFSNGTFNTGSGFTFAPQPITITE